MIDVKEAVKIAYEYFRSLRPESGSVQLEEVEPTEDEGYWLITLSHSSPDLFDVENRQYKTLKVNATDGRVVSMKIRVLK